LNPPLGKIKRGIHGFPFKEGYLDSLLRRGSRGNLGSLDSLLRRGSRGNLGSLDSLLRRGSRGTLVPWIHF